MISMINDLKLLGQHLFGERTNEAEDKMKAVNKRLTRETKQTYYLTEVDQSISKLSMRLADPSRWIDLDKPVTMQTKTRNYQCRATVQLSQTDINPSERRIHQPKSPVTNRAGAPPISTIHSATEPKPPKGKEYFYYCCKHNCRTTNSALRRHPERQRGVDADSKGTPKRICTRTLRE